LHYPSDNGELMSNDTLHFEWILFLYGAIQDAFGHRQDVFTACDLLWYPVEGRPDISRAPDAMVIFGRPKGHRPCWKQWEEAEIGPQFVAEVASKSNTEDEFREKLRFYEEYGVLECLVYDFTRSTLSIWKRRSGLDPLNLVCRNERWSSAPLGMEFRLQEDGGLGILLPGGSAARTREQLLHDWEQERQHASRLSAKLRALGIDPDAL
jgi:Uma2 family endonuclease